MSNYLDELRAAAEAEFAAKKAAPTEPPVADEPEPVADPTPELVAPVEPPASEPVQPVVEPPTPEPVNEPQLKPNRRVVYKKVVDLGDGSQPQVFKAATKDELIDKVLEAQKNATKRINELKRENRELQKQVQPDPAQPSGYQPKTLSEAEELEIASELQLNPTGAIAKAIEAALGAPLDKVRKVLSDVEQRDQILTVGRQFMAAHPEYPINDVNERRMAEYLQTNSLAWTLKNLELAFADLKEAGLVTGLPSAKPDDDIEEEEVVEPVTPQPVVKPAPVAPPAPVVPAPAPAASTEVPRRRKTVVGISSSQSAAAVEPDSLREVSVDDLLKMSPADRRRIVLDQMSRQA